MFRSHLNTYFAILIAAFVITLASLPVQADWHSALGTARSTVSGGMDRARESAKSTADHAREASNRAREVAAERARQAQEATQERLRQAQEAAALERQRIEEVARETAERERQRIAETTRRTQEITNERIQNVRSNTVSSYENIRDSARSASNSLGEQADEFRSNLGQTFLDATTSVGHSAKTFTQRIGDSSQNMSQHARNSVSSVRESISTATQKYGGEAKSTLNSMADKYGDRTANATALFLAKADEGGLRFAQKMEGTYSRVAEKISDPAAREKVVSGLVVAGAYAYYAHKNKDEIKYKAVKYGLQRTKLKLNGETKTAEQLLTDSIVAKAPFLAGSRIADDPAALIAYGVVAVGKEELIQNTPLLPDGKGGAQSIATAIQQSPSATATVEALQVSASIEKMAMTAAEDGDIGRHGMEFAAAYKQAENRFGK